MVEPRRNASGGLSSAMRTRRVRVAASACGAISRTLPVTRTLGSSCAATWNGVPDGERRGGGVGRVDHGVALRGVGDVDHHLAGRDDLADLGAGVGDDAGEIRP